jgi:hypothetical protein
MKRKKLNSIKSTGFKTPEGYFDQVSDQIMEKIRNRDEVDLPASEGFQVPKNYFEQVEPAVLSKVTKPSEAKVRRLYLKRGMTYVAGIAAILLIFFSVFPIENSESEVTLDMVENYFEYKRIDSYELAELLVESDLVEIEDLLIEPEYDDDELETYLLNNADLEEIIIY